MKIYMMEDNQKKEEICLEILTGLPAWFGRPESNHDYATGVKEQPFFVVEKNEEIIGFISLLFHGNTTVELYVLGIKEKFHQQGIGTFLFQEVCTYCKTYNELKLITVKTLAPTHPSLEYERTRLFYEKLGFFEVETFPELWDKNNPCLLMGYIV